MKYWYFKLSYNVITLLANLIIPRNFAYDGKILCPNMPFSFLCIPCLTSCPFGWFLQNNLCILEINLMKPTSNFKIIASILTCLVESLPKKIPCQGVKRPKSKCWHITTNVRAFAISFLLHLWHYKQPLFWMK